MLLVGRVKNIFKHYQIEKYPLFFYFLYNMSVYNHRPMVPTPQSRIVEMLDSIRNEFDQLAQELYVCKTQRDDFEHKSITTVLLLLSSSFYHSSLENQQISEMNNFQQSLLELERTQQNQKKQLVE